jgi:hypothetical protein
MGKMKDSELKRLAAELGLPPEPSELRFGNVTIRRHVAWAFPEVRIESPPRSAEFLVGLCAGRGARRGRGKALADATLDDLQDLFERDCEKVGVKRARMRYWARSLRSSWPLIRVALGRLMAAAGLLKVGEGFLKWLSGG